MDKTDFPHSILLTLNKEMLLRFRAGIFTSRYPLIEPEVGAAADLFGVDDIFNITRTSSSSESDFFSSYRREGTA